MKIQHFLLTRFNLHLESFDKQYTDSWPGVDENYLDNRFALFQRFCLPSVTAQKSEFIWLIFFSIQTPAKYREIIAGWKTSFNFIRPIYIDDTSPLKDEGRPMYLQGVKEFIDEDAEYVITSRIDNDDAMGYDALKNCKEATQKELLRGKNSAFFISAVNGYAYNEDYNLLQRYYYKTNHFPSLVCEKDKIDTIFSYSHVEIYSKGKSVVEIDAPCQWLEVVHSCNLDNSTGLDRPFIPLDKGWMKKNFNVAVEDAIQAEPIIIALSNELQCLQIKLAKIKSFWLVKVLLILRKCITRRNYGTCLSC